MSTRTLVAGVGNIFCGDDGFGSVLAERLLHDDMPAHVTVADFGIGGVHLAYELLNGYDTLVLLDAKDLDDEPGTIALLDLGPVGPERVDLDGHAPVLEAHLMTPDIVVDLIATLGATVPQCFLVACQPASIEPRIGLSAPVDVAVRAAQRAVKELLISLSPTTEDAANA